MIHLDGWIFFKMAQAFDFFDVGIELSSKSIRQWSCARDGRGKIAIAVSDTSWPQEGSFPAWWLFHWFYSLLESLVWLSFRGSQAFGGWSWWCVPGCYCLEHLWPVFRLWLRNQDFRCAVQSYLPWLCPRMDSRPPQTCVRCMHPVVGHLASQTQPKRRKRGWRPRKGFKRRLRHTWHGTDTMFGRRWGGWGTWYERGRKLLGQGDGRWTLAALEEMHYVQNSTFSSHFTLQCHKCCSVKCEENVESCTWCTSWSAYAGSEIVLELETIDPSFSLCWPWCA